MLCIEKNTINNYCNKLMKYLTWSIFWKMIVTFQLKTLEHNQHGNSFLASKLKPYGRMFLLAVTKFKVNTTQYAGIGHHIIYLVPINMNTLLLASKLNQADASTSRQLSYSSMLQAFVHWETKEQFSYSPPHSLAVHL